MCETAPLSQDRWEREFALKEAELRLRQRELRLWRSPVFLGLLAGALALAGNIFATLYQSKSAERQAHEKAQSDLVVEAIRTDDPQRAAKNLLFLAYSMIQPESEGCIIESRRCSLLASCPGSE
jgi:hypothetical protein